MHVVRPTDPLPLIPGAPPTAAPGRPGRRPPPVAPARSLAAGHVLVHEGDRPDAVHVVVSGALIVSATSPSGRLCLLAVLGPGDAWGHEAALPPSPESDGHLLPRLETLVPSLVRSLPSSAVSTFRGSDAAGWLCTSLAARVRRTELRLAQALQLPATERVHAVLLDLAAVHGRLCPEGLRIDLPLTQEMLAAMAGVTRESANRAVRRLREEGVLERTDGRYVVRQPGR